MVLNIHWSYPRKYFASIHGYFWVTFPSDMCRLNFYSRAACAPLSAIMFFTSSCAVIPSQLLQPLFGLQVKLHQDCCWRCKRMFTFCFRFVSKEHPACKWLRKIACVSKRNRFPSGILEMSPTDEEGGPVFTRSFFPTMTRRCPFPNTVFFLCGRKTFFFIGRFCTYQVAVSEDWQLSYKK